MKLALSRAVVVSTFAASSALLLAAGCGGGDDSPSGGNGQGADGQGADGQGADGQGATSSGGGSKNTGGSLQLGEGGSDSNGNQSGSSSTGAGGDCSADFAATELRPVRLAFAFDVSGSMGKLDKPYHDPVLKWRPVVAATRAFFENPTSAGISASLSFFPAADDKCDSSTYATPDVAMTELPSSAFGEAIAAIDPKTDDDWRGGTPTLAVVQGNAEYLMAQIAALPEAAHALVLVTDGYPQSCDDNAISSVASALEASAADFPTYVIGVRNPEGGPDTVTDLNDLAVAGGTDAAIFIDTGDPDQTAADLSAAIDRIRQSSITCDAAIPPAPAGTKFDPEKVNVSTELSGAASELGYDPECEGELGWRFDDADAPSTIVLCPSTCQAVQGDSTAKLSVEFGCGRRPVVIK